MGETSPANAGQIVVVGGGIAGLVAGLRAAELGLAVTVLEKGRGERYPCNARMSGGIFHLAYQDVKRPRAELLKALDRGTAGTLAPDLADAMASGGTRLVDWLFRHGTRFVRPGLPWQNWTTAPPRPITAGIHWIGRGPDLLLRTLGAKLRAAGGEIRLGTRATRLVMAEGRCVGVEATGQDGVSALFAADAVILCDGGFQANLELLGRHVSPQPEKVKQRGAGTGCGDGLLMAQQVGALVSRLDRFYGHLLVRDVMTSDRVWPYPDLDLLASAGILVDDGARRFADEGRGGIFLTNAVAALPDPLSTTIVFDADIWAGPGRAARIPANPHLARAGGTIHRADSIAELASKAGLPPEALEATVAQYNAAIAGDVLAALDPPRTGAPLRAWPIVRPPFYAIPACAGITYTMGGVLIDQHARVLGQGEEPIPGLYAAGSILGGIEGGGGVGYVGGLAKAGIFGLAAAEHVADAMEARRPGDSRASRGSDDLGAAGASPSPEGREKRATRPSDAQTSAASPRIL